MLFGILTSLGEEGLELTATIVPYFGEKIKWKVKKYQSSRKWMREGIAYRGFLLLHYFAMAKKSRRAYNENKKGAITPLEFLVVSKNKLKIVFDRAENEKYRLSDFSSGESTELRRRLSEILAEARARVGFNADGERLLVSYYPTRLAGAELFVTVVRASEEATHYYVFDSLDTLTRACALCSGEGGMLYLLPSGEYCISLRSESVVLSEFGEKKEERSISPIIDRSRLLKKTDAVATLASLWCEGCSP